MFIFLSETVLCTHRLCESSMGRCEIIAVVVIRMMHEPRGPCSEVTCDGCTRHQEPQERPSSAGAFEFQRVHWLHIWCAKTDHDRIATRPAHREGTRETSCSYPHENG